MISSWLKKKSSKSLSHQKLVQEILKKSILSASSECHHHGNEVLKLSWVSKWIDGWVFSLIKKFVKEIDGIWNSQSKVTLIFVIALW